MKNREIRYAAVNLSDRSVTVKKVSSSRMASVCKDAAVILSTGILTGTGAPGTGVMSWKTVNGRRTYAEGRLGAYLRYAGLDALVFSGSSSQPTAVCVENGTVRLYDAAPDLHALKSFFKTNDSCVAAVTPEGVVEDTGFCISGAGIADILAKIGVSAIVAVGTGSLPVADKKKFVALCVELYQKSAIAAGAARSDLAAVRYLSVNTVPGEETDFAYHPFRDKYAFCGIRLGRAISNNRKAGLIAELIEAYTGEPCPAADLEQAEKGGL